MTQTEILALVADVSVIVFSAGSMLAVGLGERLLTLVYPLRNIRAVFLALVANFVAVPVLAIAIVRGLALESSIGVGILLVSSAAGTPFLIKLTTAARSDVGLSATLLILLLPVTILFMPLAVPFLAPDARVTPWMIARPLILTMLLPLAVGILVRWRAAHFAQRFARPLQLVATVALITLVASLLIANTQAIIGLIGTGAPAAAIMLVAAAFGAGALLAPRGGGARVVLALGTGQRNIAAATVVATQSLRDPVTTVVVVDEDAVSEVSTGRA